MLAFMLAVAFVVMKSWWRRTDRTTKQGAAVELTCLWCTKVAAVIQGPEIGMLDEVRDCDHCGRRLYYVATDYTGRWTIS
jgi:hypothetical protein